MEIMGSLLKRFITLFIALLFTSFIFSQQTNNTLHEVKGIVTYKNLPLSNVNIIIKGTQKGTKTNSQGKYTINAKTDDILTYSYIGYNTVSVIVENVTSFLKIKMVKQVNALDEVVLSKKIKKVESLEKAMDIDIKMPDGTTINPLKYGFAIHYLSNHDLKLLNHTSLEWALNGQFSQVEKPLVPFDSRLLIRGVPATFDIDGQRYERDPGIIFDEIVHLFIIKNKALVVVRTKNAPEYLQKKRDEIAEKNKNQKFYKNDAVTIKKEDVLSNNQPVVLKNNLALKEIKGTVTFQNSPLPDVNILINKRGTKTNSKGQYVIKAHVGDIIKYSHVSFKTVALIVEDVTTILNIKMSPKINKLDKVVVNANTQLNEVLKQSKKANKKFTSSRGSIDPKKAGFAVSYLDGDEISNINPSIMQALVGRIPGARIDPYSGKFMLKYPTSINDVPPVLWDIDGMTTNREPYELDLNKIKSVHIIKSLAGTNLYGSAAAGGVVVIKTKYGSFNPEAAKRKKIADMYTNKNYYDNDAIALNTKTLFTNLYTRKIQDFNNLQKAFSYYNNTLKNNLHNYDIQISIAQKFYTYYKNANVFLQILDDVAAENSKNPEVLKALAFQLQTLGFKAKTIIMYKMIFKLRPNYAQSYRDLANAYTEYDQYKKAWRLYMSYLFKGAKLNDEGIGQTIFNEMEWLYFNRKNQTAIKEKFVPINKNITEFRNDVRLVFEWNTSEAEFDLEFVNPEKRSYVFEHSLEKNQNLITNEKTIGYSSKEFFIDNMGDGEWLVNFTYKGNKKSDPTYFKVTQYFNWGKHNQSKKTSIYNFKKEGNKVQLIKLNKQLLLATK